MSEISFYEESKEERCNIHNLSEHELGIIFRFIGFGSMDCMICQLVCSSWILAIGSALKPNHDPLSDILETIQSKQLNLSLSKSHIISPPINPVKTNIKQDSLKFPLLSDSSINTTTVGIQQSVPLFETKPKKRRLESPKSEHFYHETPTKSRKISTKINPIQLLQNSENKAFWRLPQNTLDQMIAAGKSPHVSHIDFKISKHTQPLNQQIQTSNTTLFDDSQSEIQRRRSAHSVDATKIKNLKENNSEPSKEAANSYSLVDELLIGEENFIKDGNKPKLWSPNYPLHLLAKDKHYKRQATKMRRLGLKYSVNKDFDEKKIENDQVTNHSEHVKPIKIKKKNFRLLSNSQNTNKLSGPQRFKQYQQLQSNSVRLKPTNPHQSYTKPITLMHEPTHVSDEESMTETYEQTSRKNRGGSLSEQIKEMQKEKEKKTSDDELSLESRVETKNYELNTIDQTHFRLNTPKLNFQNQTIEPLVLKNEDENKYENPQQSKKILPTPYQLRKQLSKLRMTSNSPRLRVTQSNKFVYSNNSARKPNTPKEDAYQYETSSSDRFNYGRSPSSLVLDRNSKYVNRMIVDATLISEEEKQEWKNLKKVDEKYETLLKKKQRKSLQLFSNLMLNDKKSHAEPYNDYRKDSIPTFLNSDEPSTVESSQYDIYDHHYVSTEDNERNNHGKSIWQGFLFGGLFSSCKKKNRNTDNKNEDIKNERKKYYDLIVSTGITIDTKNVSSISEIKNYMNLKRKENYLNRIKFWNETVLNNWDLMKNSKVIRLFWERDGLPHECRGDIWLKAIGNKLAIDENSYYEFQTTPNELELYAKYEKEAKKTFSIAKSSEVESKRNHFRNGLKRKNSIERDITRLYHNTMFNKISSGLMHVDVSNVIQAFCNCNPKMSYVQPMSHLTQFLLIYMTPKKAFIALSNMVQRELFSIYILIDANKIQTRINMFTKMLVYNAAPIAAHLDKLKIPCDTTFLMSWCLSLFSAQLSLKIVSRIWDLYFLSGEIIVWKSAVALLIILEEKFNLSSKSWEKTVKLLNYIPSKLCHENYFVKKIFSIKLPNDVAKWFKRKEPNRVRRRKSTKRSVQ